jgi:NADPH:quinone reductase-like Zn-dependent oxidoreductase
MEKQKMTIHRGLSELKLIDSKITSEIDIIRPLGVYQKGKLISGYLKEEDFSKQAQSSYDSINDLIKRKTLIKSAIVTANGVTKVSISGKEMTIADAINFKSVITFKKQLLNQLTSIHSASTGALNKNNEVVTANLNEILKHTFGKDNVKVSKEDVENVSKPFLDANEFHLFDPIKTSEKIRELETEISTFEMEVDACLSEINAVTFIEV